MTFPTSSRIWPATADDGPRRDERLRDPSTCWRETVLTAADGASSGDLHLEALLDRLGRRP